MTHVIRLINVDGKPALPEGVWTATKLAKAARQRRTSIGNYLETFDADAFDGGGDATFTGDPAKAMRFESFEAASACWKQQSKVRPLRSDGEPNRPLTAFCVTIEELK